MLTIPAEHKATIKALVKADPEVAQATCDIPHLAPQIYLKHTPEEEFPYCGCFVGVYDWMQSCKLGEVPETFGFNSYVIAGRTGIIAGDIRDFAGWCRTVERDHAAVRYARWLLA